MTGDNPRPLGVAIVGAGARAERWAAALRGIESCVVSPSMPEAQEALDVPLADPTIGAVVFASPRPDLATAIKRAVLARRHVLVAASQPIGARQAAAIEPLARWRRRVVLFDTPDLGDPAFAFVRRLTSGPQPLWRTRYVRAASTAGAASLDEIAVAQIVRIVGLAGEPEQVSAVSCDDADGARAAVFMTLRFDRGVVARIDLSLLEPEPRDELVVATDGRTFIIDALAPNPLRIVGALHRAPRPGGEWIETTVERPAQPAPERLASLAESFTAAVRAQDTTASNAREYALATAAWQAARESMQSDGAWLAARDDARRQPALTLIEGGGRRVAGYPAPVLTVVGPAFRPELEDAPQPA